jgi:EAL domain-containing protein (putative c-di-GMP-specific phosphodiesterase class I)
VSAIISLGQSLNLRVVAEGVETAEEMAFLKAQACDEAQGYFFSRAVAAEQFAKMIQVQ